MKLFDCDKSDMESWSRTIMADNFVRELTEFREMSLRKLVKKPTEEVAAEVRTFDRVLDMFLELRK